jgi:hypothetical protein
MNTVLDALHARLESDATLTALLSDYGGAPSIITLDVVPEAVPYPYVYITGPVGSGPFDTKTTVGFDMLFDVFCYVEKSGSRELINAIMMKIFWLLHRHKLAIADMRTLVASCAGPMLAPTDDTVYGRVITVRLVAQAT